MNCTPSINEYATAEHALKYLARADGILHRTEGESVLLEFIPKSAKRFLDLGAGGGRLLALVLLDRPDARGIAIDSFHHVVERGARQVSASLVGAQRCKISIATQFPGEEFLCVRRGLSTKMAGATMSPQCGSIRTFGQRCVPRIG